MPRDSIGFTYRIPKYITGRQNYIGFTYNLPIFIYIVVFIFKVLIDLFLKLL